MNIVGVKEYTYIYSRSGVMFFSELWHESLSPDNGTVKNSYFIKVMGT